MDRKQFIRSLALISISGPIMKLNALNQFTENLPATPQMPLLFMGHGSPMNAIEENEFVKGFRSVGQSIPKPRAILCVSAHWETKGTFVTSMEKPKTIHDFGGFPQELYAVQYPAPGSPTLALETKNLLRATSVGLDEKWGLDHGCWSVVKHLYPNADVPVIQLSIDYSLSAQSHYNLSKELAKLRSKGILIIGSGNMVHNLGMVAWDKLNENEYGYDWALEAREKMNGFILNNDHQALINYTSQGKAFGLAIPTPEHYLPLLYVLALKGKNEPVKLFNDKAIAGSLTMTSVKIG
jgi:4,5-DOPA dioxygenase extradiol